LKEVSIRPWVFHTGKSQGAHADIQSLEKYDPLPEEHWQAMTLPEQPFSEFVEKKVRMPLYVSVLVPSLRWNWRQCVDMPASDRPQECENDAPKITQEFAWTSPI
jgi:hypothetical protein